MSVFLSLSHTHTLIFVPARTDQLALCSASCRIAVCCVQYSHLFMSHRPPQIDCSTLPLCTRATALVVGGKCHKIYICCASCRVKPAKLLTDDVEFLINHSRQYRESTQTFQKIHTYIAWCDRLRAAASLHPEGCSGGFSVSDPLLENTDLFSSRRSGQPQQYPCRREQRETWRRGSDKICRSRSYSPITLGSFQTCTNAVMGMRFCVQQSTLCYYITLSKNTGIAWTRMEEP